MLSQVKTGLLADQPLPLLKIFPDLKDGLVCWLIKTIGRHQIMSADDSPNTMRNPISKPRCLAQSNPPKSSSQPHLTLEEAARQRTLADQRPSPFMLPDAPEPSTFSFSQRSKPVSYLCSIWYQFLPSLCNVENCINNSFCVLGVHLLSLFPIESKSAWFPLPATQCIQTDVRSARRAIVIGRCSCPATAERTES